MELVDYLRFRWRVFLALFVIGAIAILALGRLSVSGGNQASVQMIVQPSAAQQTVYSGDLDRYIDTQMTLLYSEPYLDAMADGAEISPGALGSMLSESHTSGSDIVVLTVTSDNPEQAVYLANRAAKGYLEVAAADDAAPAEAQVDQLSRLIQQTTRELKSARATIQQATARFRSNNPDRGTPSATVVAPDAAIQDSLLSNRLNSLATQQFELEQDIGSSVLRSEIVQPAEGARAPSGWGRTTYLAALVGLVLLLLSLAGVGLALSDRLLGRSRWEQATDGSRLTRAISARGISKRTKNQSTQRVTGSLAALDGDGDTANAVFLPDKSSALRRQTAGLLKDLEDNGIAVREMDTLSKSSADPAAPTLLFVDTGRLRLEDAARLTDLPEQVQRRIVPVLVG